MLSEIQIIYASASGNVEAVAQKLGEVFEQNRIKTTISKAQETSIEIVKSKQFFLFATSTWEHGVINPYFNRLLKEIKDNDMSSKFAGIVGLGDTRYEPVLFCAGAEELKDAFVASGGKQIGTVLKINGNPYELLDTVVTDWAKQFILQLDRYDSY